MADQEKCVTQTESIQKASSTKVKVAEVEVIDVVKVSRQDKTTNAIRENIRTNIEDGDPDLLKMWDLVTSVADPNEMLLVNLQEFQVIHRHAQNEYWANLKRNDAHLTRLLEQGEDHYDDYVKTKAELDTQTMLDRKHISDMAKTFKQLTQEYNRCVMQKKYNIHISKVIEWRMTLESVINRNVIDVNIRRAIARDMIEASRILEPDGSKEE